MLNREKKMLDMNEYRILIKSVYVYNFPLNAILVEFPRDLARPKHIDYTV